MQSIVTRKISQSERDSETGRRCQNSCYKNIRYVQKGEGKHDKERN